MDYKTLYEKTPPAKLLAIIVIPGIISMLVSSFYQIIDGAFVGQLLGKDAFAAVNLVMPLVIINFSVADLIGVGSSVQIAIKLGQKDEKTAGNIFSSACLMIIGASVILGSVLFVFSENFVRCMGAEEKLVSLASQYLKVYALFSPVTTIMFAVDNYLRICGKVHYSMIINILMSCISAALEFIFLFIFKFGIWGAALATCCGMLICAFIAFLPFIRGKLQLRFAKPKLNKYLFKSILSSGCPNFLNNIAGRATSIIMNIFLLRLGGGMAVSSYGVLMYAECFIQMMLYGLCDSLQPAVGYNWGAGNYDRVMAIEKRCFGICGILSVTTTAFIFIFKQQLVSIFISMEDMKLFSQSVHALSIFAFAFLLRWISSATQSYMSAIGKAGIATIISFSAAFFCPVALIFVLGNLGLDGLWLNYPLTSLITCILSIFILFRFRKKRITLSNKI